MFWAWKNPPVFLSNVLKTPNSVFMVLERGRSVSSTTRCTSKTSNNCNKWYVAACWSSPQRIFAHRNIQDSAVELTRPRLAREIQFQFNWPEIAIAVMTNATKTHCVLVSVCFFWLNSSELRVKMSVWASGSGFKRSTWPHWVRLWSVFVKPQDLSRWKSCFNDLKTA